MKNILVLIAKSVAVLFFLIFIFLAFVSFNTKSASFILSAITGGGFFHEKSIHVFEGLLILLVYQSCSSMAILFFGRKLQPDHWNLILRGFAVLSLVICLAVYIYSAVFPWSIPTVD
jgi:hypothetical protein